MSIQREPKWDLCLQMLYVFMYKATALPFTTSLDLALWPGYCVQIKTVVAVTENLIPGMNLGQLTLSICYDQYWEPAILGIVIDF